MSDNPLEQSRKATLAADIAEVEHSIDRAARVTAEALDRLHAAVVAHAKFWGAPGA